jgi:hypothetical protein
MFRRTERATKTKEQGLLSVRIGPSWLTSFVTTEISFRIRCAYEFRQCIDLLLLTRDHCRLRIELRLLFVHCVDQSGRDAIVFDSFDLVFSVVAREQWFDSRDLLGDKTDVGLAIALPVELHGP